MNTTESKKGLPIRPSYVLLLSALPFLIYLFWQVDDYHAALKFIAPGLWATFLATIISYLASAVLGLILVALLVIKLGKRTLLFFSAATALCLLVSLIFFMQPKVDYSLIGSQEGRVAILSGTPDKLVDAIKTGSYAEDAQRRQFRSVRDVDTAFARLESGALGAAFLPTDAIPEDANVLWHVQFLPEKKQQTAVGLMALAILIGLLTFSGWRSNKHPFAIFSELYIDAIRGIPMLVIILYVGFPLQGAIRDMSGGFINMSEMTRGIVAISLGYAAYMAEVFRAGFEAIPRGQVEAARSLGLSGWQTTRYIILPQALRIVIPPLGNEFIAMLKDTSLLSVLSVRDITQRAREYQSSHFQVFEPFNTVALLYIGLTLAASSLIKWVERRSEIKDKH